MSEVPPRPDVIWHVGAHWAPTMLPSTLRRRATNSPCLPLLPASHPSPRGGFFDPVEAVLGNLVGSLRTCLATIAAPTSEERANAEPFTHGLEHRGFPGIGRLERLSYMPASHVPSSPGCHHARQPR